MRFVRLAAPILAFTAVLYSAEHPAPGTTIVHFAKVDDGVYKGSKPKKDADYRFLQSRHIRYIMDLSFLPWLSGGEKSKAAKYGIEFIRVPMNASPVSPSEKHVDEALRILRDKRYHPIYFHCVLGRDRTGFVAALYDEYFLGMPHEQAWKEMKSYGYKDWFGIRGLKAYFNHHPHPDGSLR